ncbi:MAG: hypothetical protein ACTSYH_12160 [Candidatus Heimdallarchaeaceae archaeon]
MSDLKLSKTSKIAGPIRTEYADLTMPEKCVVSSCYPFNFPSRFCSARCRFYEICKKKE